MDKIIKSSLYVQEPTHNALRTYAALTGYTVNSVVERAVNEYMHANGQHLTALLELPPLSNTPLRPLSGGRPLTLTGAAKVPRNTRRLETSSSLMTKRSPLVYFVQDVYPATNSAPALSLLDADALCANTEVFSSEHHIPSILRTMQKTKLDEGQTHQPRVDGSRTGYSLPPDFLRAGKGHLSTGTLSALGYALTDRIHLPSPMAFFSMLFAGIPQTAIDTAQPQDLGRSTVAILCDRRMFGVTADLWVTHYVWKEEEIARVWLLHCHFLRVLQNGAVPAYWGRFMEFATSARNSRTLDAALLGRAKSVIALLQQHLIQSGANVKDMNVLGNTRVWFTAALSAFDHYVIDDYTHIDTTNETIRHPVPFDASNYVVPE